MDDALDRDLSSSGFQHGVEQSLWRLVERTDHLVWLEIHASDWKPYVMRLDCSDYGTQPIGGTFVDPQTRECIPSAWPRGNGTFQGWVKFDTGNLFICWDQDKNGINHHQEWKDKKAWTTVPPNQLVGYLIFMARLLNSSSMGYEPRTLTPS